MKRSHRYKLKLKTPSSWQGDLWKDALPCGNGKIGAAVYGGIKQETILVNHNRLWHWGKRSNIPDVSEALKETRKLIQQGRYDLANSISSDALCAQGYESKLYAPCPVGDIRIKMHQEEAFKSYQRVLDMESGEVQVKWISRDNPISRKTFVSRIRDVIVVAIESPQNNIGMELTMCLHETYGDDVKWMKAETETAVYQKEGCLIYESRDGQGNHFGMVFKILKCDGETELSDKKVDIRSASAVVGAAKVFGSMDAVKSHEEAMKTLESLPKHYDSLLAEHKKEHSRLFHSAGLELEEDEKNEKEYSNEEWLLDTYEKGISNSLCEKLWHYGRYLFISGTDPEELPFNMYGLWGGRYELMWSHNMANINIQMMYWQCISGGYVSYIKALIDYYYNLMPDLRENAEKVFGMAGIYLPAGTTPGYGLINQIVPVIVNWIGGAGWIAQHMYEYYEATGDKKMLEEKILPFMTEAALFYEQYLLKEGEIYQIYPSVSPENTPGNFNGGKLYHMAHANPTAKNATMDIAIIRELLTNLLTIYREEDYPCKKMLRWEEILAGLPKYMINQEGAIKEWTDEKLEDFYYHRHISHLYPLFPGKEIDKAGNEAARKHFKKAVDLRILGGQSGWSMAQMACVYARLKEGDKARECIENITKSCLTNSFFTLHNDWREMGLTLDLYEFENADKAPVQLDANLGIVGAIQEMLFYHVQNKLMLLPALPKQWKKGRVQNFCFIGGKIDIAWDMDKIYLEFCIHSEGDRNIIVYLPENFIGKVISEPVKNSNVAYSGQLEISLKRAEKRVFRIGSDIKNTRVKF